MRGRIGVFSGLINGNGRTNKVASFSTSGFGSGGRGGRGRGGVSVPNFVAGNGNENENEDDEARAGAGAGHGRGNPLTSNSFIPSFVASNPPPPPPPGIGIGIGRGRGRVGASVPGNEIKSPIFLKKDDDDDDDAMGTSFHSIADHVQSVPRQPIGAIHLPEHILTSLTGTGRGKPQMKPSSHENVKEDNRHLRPRRVSASASATPTPTPTVAGSGAARPKLSREEAVKKAVGVLSRGDEGRKAHGGLGGGRRRSVGGWKDDEDEDDKEADSEEEDRLLGVGDDANAEKLANKLGTSRMAELSEALDDMLEESVPEPGDDEYLDAYDTNLKIELEPEYLMGDFETNPDINENPPIPLREALEKMKPFLMAYEGIEDQEEWEVSANFLA